VAARGARISTRARSGRYLDVLYDKLDDSGTRSCMLYFTRQERVRGRAGKCQDRVSLTEKSSAPPRDALYQHQLYLAPQHDIHHDRRAVCALIRPLAKRSCGHARSHLAGAMAPVTCRGRGRPVVAEGLFRQFALFQYVRPGCASARSHVYLEMSNEIGAPASAAPNICARRDDRANGGHRRGAHSTL